ncbi:LPS O-antigen chain length determinant protein WzzB [Pseudomonas defluvii]|uniref:LPS O-antigen chain length determinant protein WzzB n=1 Tax=Pseudomonas defluvii TaxID=1876757 RepID=UPI003906BFE5
MAQDSERLIEPDDIDLIELIKGLWQQKMLIMVTTTVIFLAALAYALLARPVYEAKVFVQPPTQNDIAHLNYGRGPDTGLDTLTVKDIYDVYVKHLQSESLRRSFFQTVYLPTLTEQQRNGSQDLLYRNFNKLLVVAVAAKDTPTRFAITANVYSPQQAAEWVTNYAQLAGDRAKQEVLKNIKSDATVKANNLEQQIATARESSRERREDEIVQLKEALQVAKSIGLEKPPIISGNLSTEVSAGMEGSLTYMRGSKALEAEIENLQKRQSDDPFIQNLRQQQAALTFYRNLSVDPALVAVYRQDGVVEQPDKPVKPKKLLIVLLGLVAGVVVGVVLALMRHLYRQVLMPKRSLLIGI